MYDIQSKGAQSYLDMTQELMVRDNAMHISEKIYLEQKINIPA
jgi:hypothetical protein